MNPAMPFLWMAALPNLAERRTAIITAPLLAPELHHGPEELVTLHIMCKGFPERCIRNGSGGLVRLYTPQYFPEVAGMVGDNPGVPVAVRAAEPAIRNHLRVLFHQTGRVWISGLILSPREAKIIEAESKALSPEEFP